MNAFQEEPLHATMFESLSRHFNGIHYRERNAGSQIDEHMQDQGENGINHAIRVRIQCGRVRRYGNGIHLWWQ